MSQLPIAAAIAKVVARHKHPEYAVPLVAIEGTDEAGGYALVRLPSTLIRNTVSIRTEPGSQSAGEEEHEASILPERVFAQDMPENIGAILQALATAAMVAWPGFTHIDTPEKAAQWAFCVVGHLMGLWTLEAEPTEWTLSNILESIGDPPTPVLSTLVFAAGLDTNASVEGTGAETVIRITTGG